LKYLAYTFISNQELFSCALRDELAVPEPALGPLTPNISFGAKIIRK
jgi:hypothetical protein